jgi:hypothetical protein
MHYMPIRDRPLVIQVFISSGQVEITDSKNSHRNLKSHAPKLQVTNLLKRTKELFQGPEFRILKSFCHVLT